LLKNQEKAMPKSIQQHREHYTELVNSANNILAQKGDQLWTKDDQVKFDGFMDQAYRVKDQIDSIQRIMDQDVEENFRDVDNFRKDGKQISDAKRSVDVFMRKSFKEMSIEDALLIRNTMSTTTGSEGGYTVQSEVASTFIDALKAFGFMRAEASQITTSMGNNLSFPTTDGTSETGEWVAQNTTASDLDVVLGTVAVNVFKAGSKVITIPIELLQDSNIDIQALVFARMIARIGRIANTGYTVGSGTGQPQGFVGVSSVGKVGTTGQTLTVIYDDLVDLIDSVDVAYQENGAKSCFMFNQTTRKVLRKLKDTAGRPIWTPSYDAGIAGAHSDQLLGYDVCLNNDMAVPAANAKSIGFGQFDKYLIRDALELSLFRFDDSAYMKKGQVGFLGWARTGGNLLDTAAIKLYQHSAT
jgi:HK97 family phage major capsid protein